MSIWRVVLAIVLPPLAVWDKGCGSILIVFLLTLLGWIPGVIAALVILNNPNREKLRQTLLH
ncbi:MAG: YqaE/Pmp3 family membrane protein [Moheibacter sp.]